MNGTNGVSNLGASILGTLNIPIWNWGATQSRVKQAELRRAQAQREVSLAQRRLLAEIKSLYSEAETAMNELGGLGRSAELAEESLRLTTLRYKGGEATVLEVVDAQTTYAQSNAAYQDGAVRYRPVLEGAGAEVPPDDSDLHVPWARLHVALARAFGSADVIEPIYLRVPDAERAPAG